MNRRRRVFATTLALLALTLAGVLAAPTAMAVPEIPDIPGLPGGPASPTPEVPGRGVVGFFESGPKTPPPAGDPWAPNSSTSIYEQYGYAGLRFHTYDLGTGPDLIRAPDASIGTSIANWMFTFPKAAVAATGAVVSAAFEPDFLGVFDPLVTQVVETLRTTVFEQWIFLTLAAVGLLLMWRARHASLASSAGAVGWALLVLVLATLLFRWPLVAGNAADETVTATLGAVTGGLNGTAPQARENASTEATAGMHEALLYQAWLGGTFGDANSEVAKRYGPDIFDSQALTWREAQIMRDDPGRGRKIIETKQEAFAEAAEKVKAEDPDAYEYLTGKRSDTRVGYALLASVATLCAVPFLLVAGLLVLGALIIVRFGVMLFPAFATLGLFPTMRTLVTGIGNTVAAALINAMIFGIGAAVTVKGIGVLLAPSTGLAPWLDVVLVLLLTIVMWVALRPFRRLSQMVSRNRNHFGAATSGVGTVTRGFARAGGRILTTALGTFLGVAAANRREEHELAGGKVDGVPQRAEANSTYADVEPDEGTSISGPVQITAGTVTVSSAPAEGASLAGAVGAGGGSGGALGGGAGAASPSPAVATRAEGSRVPGGFVGAGSSGGASSNGGRTPALSGSAAGSNGASDGGRATGGSGDDFWASRGGSRSDSGGRFEASGLGGGRGSGGSSGGSGGRPRRSLPPPGSEIIDLSDYEWDELVEIFHPDRQPSPPQPERARHDAADRAREDAADRAYAERLARARSVEAGRGR